MSQLRALLLLAVSAIFVALGVFLAIRGEPSGKPLSFGIMTFFGACAFVAALQFAPRQRAELDADGGLTLRSDRLQTGGSVIAALAMAVGCYALAPFAALDGDLFVSLVAYAGAAFFGLGALALVWRTLHPRLLARLDAEGVHVFGPMGWTLTWRDIKAISTFDIHGQRFIKLESSARQPPIVNVGGFTISAAGTRLAFEDLHALTIELWQRDAR